jgi:uncharacterized membrane protein YraQ (UPF0718 family)
MFSNSLEKTLIFFGTITVELVVLFFAVSILVKLLMQYVLVEDNIKSCLTRRRGLGNVFGGLFGSITPFCSASTIPILVGLLQASVPFGTAISFLLASPLLNPIVVGILAVMFGWRVTVLYTLVTFVLVVVSGFVWEKLGLQRHLKQVKVEGIKGLSNRPESFRIAFRWAALGALNELRSFLPYLLIGVEIGAAAYGFVPQDFIARIAGPGKPLAIPIAAVIGIPLYIRIEMMLPIAMVLLEKGVSIGAIVALIIGATGASITEVSLLARMFKSRLLIAFLVTVFSVAIAAGYLFNFALG